MHDTLIFSNISTQTNILIHVHVMIVSIVLFKCSPSTTSMMLSLSVATSTCMSNGLNLDIITSVSTEGMLMYIVGQEH